MQARCLTNFVTQDKSGVKGEMITINDQATMDELVKSGFVEAVGTTNQDAPPAQETPAARQPRKRSE